MALTDRIEVAKLCEENISLNFGPRVMQERSMFASELEWTSNEALALKEQMGGSIDMVLACDCIFAPLYGDSFPLLRMLEYLVDERTRGEMRVCRGCMVSCLDFHCTLSHRKVGTGYWGSSFYSGTGSHSVW